MTPAQAQSYLNEVRGRITTSGTTAATESFSGLREVDAMVREVKVAMALLPGTDVLLKRMDEDQDFVANSRRVRLEALRGYIDNALRLMNHGALGSRPSIYKSPDITKLTAVMPLLKLEIEQRWLEAQKAQHHHLHLSAIILMGSILEGLALCRTSLDPAKAMGAQQCPKDRSGKPLPCHDWNLSQLIDVCAELGWIKVDRAKFSHALRQARNIVHPWEAARQKINFDEHSVKTAWTVLEAASDDLIKSVP